MKSLLSIFIGILLLENCNAQWVKMPNFSAINDLSQIQFVDKNTGWMNYIYCDNCNVFQTVNGGKNWKEVMPYEGGFGGTQCSFLYFKDKNEGIVSWGKKIIEM